MDVPCATVLLDDVYSAATAAGGGDEDVCSLPVKVEKIVSHHLLVVSAGGEADGLAMEKERFTPVHAAGGAADVWILLGREAVRGDGSEWPTCRNWNGRTGHICIWTWLGIRLLA